MSSMSEIMLVADEIINAAIDTRGYGYGSVIDQLDARNDLDRNQRQCLVEYFQELFEHDAH